MMVAEVLDVTEVTEVAEVLAWEEVKMAETLSARLDTSIWV